MVEEKKEKDRQDSIKQGIDFLFSIPRDISRELKSISEYYSFLADKINPKTFSIEIRQDLIQCFEAVYLLLMDKLQFYPETIKDQVSNINKEHHICEIMAVAGSVDPSDLNRIKFRSSLQTIADIIPFLLRSFKVSINNGEYIDITRKSLFTLKVSLNRMSSILNYASTIELADYDESFYKFRKSYDPDLIDKNKLLAFINILRVQINSNPDSNEKSIIVEKLDSIEKELRRSKVRWGIVITGFFILFGFFADLKTIAPDIYKEPYAVIQRVLATIHEDGVVSGKPPQLLEDRKDNTSNENPIDQPRVALSPKREDEYSE
jgi:hypothetical protein